MLLDCPPADSDPDDPGDAVAPVADAVRDRAFYGRLVDALSTRNYRLYGRSGHDQFFSTFAAFGPAARGRAGEMLAEAMRRAGAQNILYLVAFASREAPDAGIALHAGELTLGLVPPEALRFHIRQAVEIAGAHRIGHGTDVLYEDDPRGLLDLLARRDVLVEINLTSSDVILGVTGDAHPFPVYRATGVATTLSTDDEGVSRIDLTHEYLRAVLTYDLSWADVVELSRNSLLYAFLPPTEKAALLEELDRRLAAFEQAAGAF